MSNIDGPEPITFKPIPRMLDIRPMPSITPFTDRDGDTYTVTLERILKHLNELAELFNTQMGAQSKWVTDSINAAIVAVEAMLAAQDAANAEAIKNLSDKVDAAVESILNASIEVNDLIIARVIEDVDSATREILDTLYKGVRSINGEQGDVVIGTTELSPNTLPKRSATSTLPGIANATEPDEAVNFSQFRSEMGGLSESIGATVNGVRDALRFNTRSVTEFGAVGDGVADDTAAFQRCADAAGGGFMVIPPGTYNIPGFVHIKSGTQVWGYGATLTKSAVRTSVALFAIRTGNRKGYGAGGTDIGFYGIRTLGRADQGESCTLLSAHHAQGLRVQDCVGVLSVSRGHWIDLNGCDNVVIDNCHLWGAAIVSGAFPGEAIQIDLSAAGSMSQVEDVDNGYDGLPTIRTTISGCTFNRYRHAGTTYPAPSGIGSHTSPTTGFYEDIRIRDCYFGPTQDKTSGVRGAVHFISVKNLTVDNCTFDGDKVNVELFNIQPGYDGTIESLDIKVANSTFVGGTATQLALNTGSIISVSDNSFRGFGGSAATTYCHGISVGTPVTAFTISGNKLESNSAPHPTSRGVYLNAGTADNEGTMFGNHARGAAPGYGGGGNTNSRVAKAANVG